MYDNDGTTNSQIGKLYDNNGTTDSLIYTAEQVIYDAGVINTALVGGLTAYAYKPGTSSSTARKPDVTKGSNYIKVGLEYATALAGSYFVNNAIDLTNISYIKINVSSIYIANTDNISVRLGVTTAKANNFTPTKHINITATGTVTLDVSSLSGTHYIYLTMHGLGSKYIQFTKWWIE